MNNYIEAGACEAAKAEMKANKTEWVKQARDWEEMGYDEYYEKYWGI